MNEYIQIPPEIIFIDTRKLDSEESEERATETADAIKTNIDYGITGVVRISEKNLQQDDAVLMPHSGEALVIAQTPEVAPETARSVIATVLLPAYNEEAALPEVLKSLLAVLDDSYEILVVDDGSSDRTPVIAQAFPCRLIVHRQNQGKGAAVRTGLAAARGEYVIVMDADNTYPPEAIPEIVALLKDHDFVRGIRRLGAENTPMVNRLGNKLIDSALKLMYGLEGNDHLSGLYGLRREAFNSMHFIADGFDVEVEIGIKAYAHKLRSGMIPIDYHERLGEKKLRPIRDGWKILHRMMSLALIYNPSRMFLVPGLSLWAIAAIFTFLIGTLPSSSTPSLIGINTQSFIVAALGVPAGFQLIVFGIAAALYGVERHIPPQNWLITLSRARVRFWAGTLGTALFLGGVALLLLTAFQWAVSANNADIQTRTLVVALVFILWGFQTILAVLFISIFAGRVDKTMPVQPVQAVQAVQPVRAKHSYPLAVSLQRPPEAE